ncbi:CD109 antigen-like [Conger conger]|uniref:CD109 antigen-like n=1 Tax=Conger conger TaxID=82655 RepID=UPI002A5AA559|nr:CD109 antigen-like [Conger conger]
MCDTSQNHLANTIPMMKHGGGSVMLWSPSFLVAVPSEIQLGVPTSLSVTVLIDSPVSVTAEVFSDNTSILDSAASPPPPYTLVVNGYVGKMLVFSNTTIMQIKALSFTTFIQTDKSRYEPGQAVKIRAISIYSDGKPYKGPADITIKDPKGNLVQRWQLVESYLGVATRELQLSENPRPGMWTILVTVNEVIKRNFMVEHYVQPNFEVLVNVPSIIHYEDNLIGKVNAQYPNGKLVHGVMTVMAELFNGMSANKTKKISGSGDFVFSKADFTHHFGLFKRSVKPKEGDDMVVINVIAWVTETLTGLKYSRKTIVKVVFQKYHLEFFNYPRVLRTSLNFTAQVGRLFIIMSGITLPMKMTSPSPHPLPLTRAPPPPTTIAPLPSSITMKNYKLLATSGASQKSQEPLATSGASQKSQEPLATRGEWLSVDESMVPYYGRHGWLGQGPSVVLGLSEQAQVPQGCKFTHDNLFTSLALLDEMTKRRYGSSGTVRQNRLFDVPFMPQKDFMKLPRGTAEVLTQGEKLLVWWKDNNIVTVATNVEEKYSEVTVKRWNKERRAFDKVQQPKCITKYNEHMGGVDLHDLQVSRYHISIRSKKWWWPIFAWSLNSALVNSHLFYRDVMGGTIDLLTFSRILAQSLVQRFGTKPLSHGRRSRLAATVKDQLKVLLYNQSTLTPMDRMNNITIDMRQVEDNGRKESLVQLSLPVPEDGIIDLSFPVLDQVSMLVLQAEFQKNAVFLELMRHYTSPSSSYIQINRSSSPAHVGIPLWFTAESSYPLSEFHYLVMARGTIVASGTVTSMSFSLTPEDSWAPLAHLVIYSIRSDGEIVNDAIFLHVNQLQRNEVSLSWSQANVKPGEEVSLTVTVSEPESLVGIQVVDNTRNCPELCNSLTEEEVLEGLTEDNMDEDSLPLKSGDPFSIFTTCNIIVLTDAKLPRSEVKRPVAEEEMEDESKGVDVDWEPGACRDWIWLEKNMSTTTAKLSFSVPDHITSWHASAFVVSDNLGLGLMSTPAKLTVSQKMFVSLDLPHYIIRGEQLVLEVQLCHNFEKDLEALVFVVDSDLFEFVYADNQSSQNGMPRNLFVRSGNCATALFPIRPKDLGTMSVTVKAVSIFGSDTVTSTVLVKSEGIEESFIKSLFLELVPFADNHSKDITFTFPPDVVPGSQRAEVAAVGNILGPTLSGLESLIQMPYGCGEQNMIHFAPNIYVLKFLTVTGQVEDEIYNRAISFMTTGYQNELSYQREDGSFSAFGDNDAFGSTWLSAFVLRCFLQARQFITIDANVLSQTAAWLVKQQRPDGAFNEPGRVIHTELQGGQDHSRNISLTAYVLMALLEDQTNKDLYADTVTNALLFLESKLTEGISSNYSLCLVSYALSLSLRVSAQTALHELLGRADIIDGVVFWSLPGGGLKDSWQPRSAYIEMVAYALLSLHTQAKVVEGIPLMKWLSEQRNQLGGYGSTQDTVIALQALSQYAHFSGSDAIDLRITVSTKDSYTLAMFNINSENTLLLQTQEIETGNDIHLTVALEGRGFALFQLNVFYNLDGRKVSQPRSGHEDAEAFDLDIDVVEEDLDHISLTICTQLRDGLHIIQTGMALVEVSMLSGFTAVEGGIQINDIVRKVETPPGKVVLYLDSLTTARVCFNIPAVRDFKVAKVQNGSVVICDYYEPRRKVEREYNSEMMRHTSICAFCGEDCSKCRDVGSGGVSVSRLLRDNICSLAWALLILAAVGR